MKQCEPTWLVCVWRTPGFGVCYQIDLVDANGENARSTNPDTLRREGYDVPDFSHLPHGQYRLGDLTPVAGHGART